MSIFRSIGKVAMTGAIALSVMLPSIASAQDATPAPYTPGTDLASLSGKVTADGSSTVVPDHGSRGRGVCRCVAGRRRSNVDFSGTGGGFERFCAARPTCPMLLARSRKRRSHFAPRTASTTTSSKSPTTASPLSSTRRMTSSTASQLRNSARCGSRIPLRRNWNEIDPVMAG